MVLTSTCKWHAGEIEWTDPRVRETFENWGKLVRMGAFIDDHQNKDWQQSLPFVVNGEAGAILNGQLRRSAAARCWSDR